MALCLPACGASYRSLNLTVGKWWYCQISRLMGSPGTCALDLVLNLSAQGWPGAASGHWDPILACRRWERAVLSHWDPILAWTGWCQVPRDQYQYTGQEGGEAGAQGLIWPADKHCTIHLAYRGKSHCPKQRDFPLSLQRFFHSTVTNTSC